MVRKVAGWVPAHGHRQQREFPRSCLGLHAVSSGSQEFWVGLAFALGREALSQQGAMPELPASPLPAPCVGGHLGAGLQDPRLSPHR